MTLDYSNLNLTKDELMALNSEEKQKIFTSLPSNSLAFESERQDGKEIPETPCVIDGVLILE